MAQRLTDFLNSQGAVATNEPKAMRLSDVLALDRNPKPGDPESSFDAAGFMQISDNQRSDWKKQGPIGYGEAATRIDKTEMIPFLGTVESAAKSVKLLNAVNRLKLNKYEQIPGQRAQDVDMVNRYMFKMAEEQVRGVTIGGRIITGAGELPSFMGEFLATGGLAALGKEGVKQTIKQTVKGGLRTVVKTSMGKFAARTSGAFAGAVVRTTVGMPQRTVEGYADRQINAQMRLTDKGMEILKVSQEKPFVSAMKAYGDQIIENFSEVTGAAIGAGAKRLFPKKAAAAITQLYKKLHPNESLNKLFTTSGYNGFLEELGEERIGDLLRALTGVEDFGADEGANVFDRVVASIPNAEQLLVEAGVLAIPGAVHVTGSQALEIYHQRIKQTPPDQRPANVQIDETTGEALEMPEGDLSQEQIEQISAERTEETAPAQPPVFDIPEIEKVAPEATTKEVLAVRHGEIQEGGAYFSTQGTSTYFDPESPDAKKYDIGQAKIATSGTSEMKAILQHALTLKNSPEEAKRIAEALQADNNTDNFVDYLLFDEVPSIKAAAEALGYDGVKVWENDDIADPSSVFIWNVDKVKEISPKASSGSISQEIPDEGFESFDVAIAEGRASQADKEFTREVFRLTDEAEINKKIHSHPRVIEAEKKRTEEAKPYWDIGPNDELPDYWDEYIKSKNLSQFEPGNPPEVVFMMGLPASQKSQFAKKMGLKNTHVLIDPDEAKEFIPEFKEDPVTAEYVHNESVKMSEDILLQRVLDMRLNILWPKIGRNAKSMREKIRDLKKLGYRVVVIHNKLSPIESAKRAFKRFLETGRYIPPEYIEKIGLKTEEVYDIVKTDADLYVQNDVNVPFTEKAKELERGGSDAQISKTGTDQGPGSRPGERSDLRKSDKTSPAAPEGSAEAFEQRNKSLTFEQRKALAESIIESFNETDLRQKIGFRGMRKYPSGKLAEEQREVPAFYWGKGTNLRTPDEVAGELGYESDSDLFQAIKEYEKRRPDLERQVHEARKFLTDPVVIRKRRETLVKEKLRTIEQGIRKGKILGRIEVKEVQGQLIDLIKDSDLDANDREKFVKTIRRIQTHEQLAKEFPEIQERILALENKAILRQTKADIKSLLKGTDVGKQSGKPVGKFTPEIQNILDKLRIYSKLTRAEAMDKIQSNLVAIGDGMATEEQALDNRMLSLMAGLEESEDPQFLRDLLEEIQTIIDTGRAGGLLREFARAERNAQIVDDALSSILGDKVPEATTKNKKEGLKETLGSFWIGMLGWDNKLDYLSQDDKGSKENKSRLNQIARVDREINNEKRHMVKNAEKVIDMAARAFGFTGNRRTKEKNVLHQFRQDAEIVNLGSFINRRGERVKFEISKAQARKLYMELQDPTIRESLTGEEQVAEGIFDIRGNAYSQEMLDALNTFLTQEDKAFADAQLEFYRDYWKSVNKIYRIRYGVDLPFNEFYSPIRRQGYNLANTSSEFLQEVGIRRSVASGSLKSRIPNFREISLQHDVEVLQRHILEMEHFKNWVFKIQDLNTIFGNGEIRQAIKKKYGSPILKSIDFHIQNFTANGIEKAKGFEAAIELLRINFTRSALAIKPAITIKQMASFLAYADEIPTVDFIRGVGEFVKNPAEKIRILFDSPLVQTRGKDFNRDVKDAFNSDEFAAFRKIPSWRNMILFNVRYGDYASVFLGGWSVYSYHVRQGKSHSQALEEFEKATASTQQSGDLDQLSDWQRGGPIAKLFTMFTSAQNQYFRKELSAVRNLIKGRMTPKEAAKRIFIYHFLLPMFFQWVSDFGKWNKDEQLRAAILGSLNGIFILGNMLDTIVRAGIKAFGDSDIGVFDSEIPAFQFSDGVKKAIQKLDADEIWMEDVIAALADLSEGTVAPLTGIPIKQIFDAAEGLSDIGEGETGRGALKLMGWSPTVVDRNLDREEE